MNRREELKQIAKEIKTEAGVFKITNIRNDKVLVEAMNNLKRMNGQQFTLEMGTHPNKKLQSEFTEFGKDAFKLEVLEVLKKKTEGYFDEKDELKKLKEKWLKELQPYGERGYND
ncbi:GIY-YIG nuclease family protein [Paenibacillus sp. KN14-4R]|uniref:GIY-YIG nuclease family protein n=1 Tax=Paenibacillus sp. KN14-4R TaxID=3445773 RepID=UPI003FA16DE0